MIIYIVLIIVPLLLVNYLSTTNMTATILRDIEMNQLKTANILSNIARANINDLIELKMAIKQYPIPMDGRVVVTDKNMLVISDSFNYFEGSQINNAEIRSALIKDERQGYYFQEKNILHTAVPIIEARGEERFVLGAVLISISMDEPFGQINNFRRQLLGLSLGAAFVGFLAALWASRKMAKPIEELSRVAILIGQGNLGEEVNIDSKDEIGKLAVNFNRMSKELQRIDRGRMQFIGDVSHELRTPLASMKALIDSLLYGENDIEVYKEYLSDMDSEIDRLASLVKSLLSLTKIEEVGVNKELVSVQKLINNSYKVIYPLAEKLQVKMDISINDKISVNCDEQKITEVLINLIDNAIKYRDVKKNFPLVKIYDKKEKEDYFVIVEDNGVGIEKKDLDLIFEKFYRSDFSRSRDTGGAGIGLSIVSRIISVHKWTIGVESELRKGTKIIIKIPKKSFRESL